MKVYPFFLLLVSITCFSNQVFAKSLSLNFVNPSFSISVKDTTVTYLKVTGIIDRKTIYRMNKYYPNLEVVNMQHAKVVAYSEDNQEMFPANEIPNAAFNSKLKLKTVILPKGIVRIGKGAFWNCNNLENIILFDSVKVIDQFAFQLCTKLKRIVFPESLLSLGGASFASCPSLVSIKFKSKTPPLMPEWTAFPDIVSNTCVLYAPAKSIPVYQKSRFYKKFKIKAL